MFGPEREKKNACTYIDAFAICALPPPPAHVDADDTGKDEPEEGQSEALPLPRKPMLADNMQNESQPQVQVEDIVHDVSHVDPNYDPRENMTGQ